MRLGTPAGTTRGFGVEEFKQIGEFIGDVLDGLATTPENPESNQAIEQQVLQKVESLCAKFPIYGRT